MTGDEYLYYILSKYSVDNSSVKNAANTIFPVISSWAGSNLISAEFSGSIAKGTNISNSSDADIFISLKSTTPHTLKEIYERLNIYMINNGYFPRKQNVSLGVSILGYSIDLVPGRRQSQFGNDHSLYRSKTDSWTQTNINNHINHIKNSGRQSEIKIIKIWRQLHKLKFCSFFLEMAVIDALKYAKYSDIEKNVIIVLKHLRDNIQTVKYTDPANTNNLISDECTLLEKIIISNQAYNSLSQENWKDVIW